MWCDKALGWWCILQGKNIPNNKSSIKQYIWSESVHLEPLEEVPVGYYLWQFLMINDLQESKVRLKVNFIHITRLLLNHIIIFSRVKSRNLYCLGVETMRSLYVFASETGLTTRQETTISQLELVSLVVYRTERWIVLCSHSQVINATH